MCSTSGIFSRLGYRKKIKKTALRSKSDGILSIAAQLFGSDLSNRCASVDNGIAKSCNWTITLKITQVIGNGAFCSLCRAAYRFLWVVCSKNVWLIPIRDILAHSSTINSKHQRNLKRHKKVVKYKQKLLLRWTLRAYPDKLMLKNVTEVVDATLSEAFSS